MTAARRGPLANLTTTWGLDIYLADPHNRWQRGLNENGNRHSASGCAKAATCSPTPNTTSTASATYPTPNPPPTQMAYTQRHLNCPLEPGTRRRHAASTGNPLVAGSCRTFC